MNYQSIITGIESGKFVDQTDYFMPLLQHRYVTLENCSGTYASSLLRCLACFLDESTTSRNIFKTMKVGQHKDFNQEINSCCVLWLDFSDFEAGSFEAAIEYLKDKMSSVYKCNFSFFEPENGRYYDYKSLEYALDIIERKCSIEELQYSMERLVYQLRDHKYRKDNFKLATLEEYEQCPSTDINDIPEGYDWGGLIEERRREIENAKNEEERKKQELIRYEMKRYAEELSPMVPRLSVNLGIRKKQLNNNSCKYKELTKILREVYTFTYPKIREDDIYRYLLKLNEKEIIIDNEKQCKNHLESLVGNSLDWKAPNVNLSSGYWAQVIYPHTKEGAFVSEAQPGNIKVYACLKTTKILETFYDSLRYLLSHACNTFAAKVAYYNRSDQMCYWLSPDDFKCLENFYKPYYHDMSESMPFISYKGKLGISKEFPGADCSHNSMQAHIISDYLKTVANVGEVDLEAMYNNFIAKWNADMYEESDYGAFKNCSALSFVVVLDTLDAILGDMKLTDSSFLLSDNRRLWHILSNSKCWADVNAIIDLNPPNGIV